VRFLPLVWCNLMRRKTRTVFTALSIFVAFALFALLMAIRSAFSYGAELAGADRLMMFHKVSFSQPLPVAYQAQIAATPGVAAVTHATWFGGVYQDPKNRFVQLAVDAESFLALHPDYLLPQDQRQAWLADRTGCIIGRDLAARFGWNVGDRIPLQGVGSWRRPDGTAWAFTIDGIYDSHEGGTNLTQMYFHYDYLNERRTSGRDHVGWYLIRVSEPARAAQVAEALDQRFANSSHETRTATEKAFLQAWAHQIGDIGSIMIAVLGTVLFTILLVVGNTMAQSIRERTNELAVLKTLGFTDAHVLGLVLLESLVLTVVSGALALALAWAIIERGDPTGGLLPSFYLGAGDFALGCVLVLALGLAAGTIPAWQAGRLRIADALRRQG
jgi:putative ABC transport system permease protein